jgi:branched-chain amino acid aminotransferase
MCIDKYFVCPVSHIHHRGIDLDISLGSDGIAGDITKNVKTWFEDILYGKIPDHPWAIVVQETER